MSSLPKDLDETLQADMRRRNEQLVRNMKETAERIADFATCVDLDPDLQASDE